MQKCSFFVFLTMLVSVSLPAAITQVTVYPSGAQIRESRQFNLKAGVNELELGGLGQSVDGDSLRVTTPAGVRVLDRKLAVTHLTDEQNATRAKLEDALRMAREKLQTIDDELQVVSKKEAYFDKIENASTNAGESENYTFPTPAQWETLIKFIENARLSAQKEKRVIVAERLQAPTEVERIIRQMQELNNPREMSVQKMVLIVESKKEGAVTLGLTYFDADAGWRPAYQVWVDGATKGINVIYGAYVRQRSAQDWKDVQLTLSTARPQQGATAPKLDPWWVSERQENAPRPMMAKARMTMAADTAMAGANAEMSFAPVEVQQMMTFAQFVLPGKNSLPSDGQEHRYVVSELPLKGELVYQVTPELAQEAYLQAKVVNTSDVTLLPGPTQLYNDENFVGQSMLETVQPGESFTLDLGMDPAIKVERKQLTRKVDLTGLTEDNRKINYRYSIELTNLKKSAQKINVTERVPVSQHEKIRVELKEPREMAKSVDKEGMMNWALTLEPGKPQTIFVGYTVEFPKKMNVEGAR